MQAADRALSRTVINARHITQQVSSVRLDTNFHMLILFLGQDDSPVRRNLRRWTCRSSALHAHGDHHHFTMSGTGLPIEICDCCRDDATWNLPGQHRQPACGNNTVFTFELIGASICDFLDMTAVNAANQIRAENLIRTDLRKGCRHISLQAVSGTADNGSEVVVNSQIRHDYRRSSDQGRQRTFFDRRIL
jgi:hypothetical protein